MHGAGRGKQRDDMSLPTEQPGRRRDKLFESLQERKVFMNQKSEKNELCTSMPALALEMINCPPNEWKDKADKSTCRFLDSVKALHPDQCLGWHFGFQEESWQGFVFLNHASEDIGEKDLAWMIQDSAAGTALSFEAFSALWPRGQHEYALKCYPDSLQDSRDWSASRSFEEDCPAYFPDLLKHLQEAGQRIRFLSGLHPESGRRLNTLLLSSPNPLSLQEKTLFTKLFPFGQLVEIRECEPLDAHCALLPSSFLGEILSLSLQMLFRTQRGEAFSPFPGEEKAGAEGASSVQDDEALEDDHPYFPEGKPGAFNDSCPLEDLDFSVRTYNCLMRHGIDTLGELRAISDEDLQRVRNLGRRGLEEIRRKLAEYPAPPLAPLAIDVDYQAQLDGLIGLEAVKDQIRSILAYVRMQQDMATRKLPAAPFTLNMAFTGNPGTAKTTVARILAGLLYQIGFLSKAEAVEVGRSELIGEYVGKTAINVRKAFEKAQGGLLFIDEAYALLDDYKRGYGDEAINTIVREMENRRGETMVVFAGYPAEMEDFLARNPGLKSRVPFVLHFPDYTPEDLREIALLEAHKQGGPIAAPLFLSQKLS